MTDDFEQLGRLIAALPPVPTGWEQAAQELPQARRALDELIARAIEDAELRSRLVADLEAALDAAGIVPTERVIAEVRNRLMPSS